MPSTSSLSPGGAPSLEWEAPVFRLGGIGPERARALERLGIRTVGDLVLHRPRRYEDRSRLVPIRDIRDLGPVTVQGRVVAAGVTWFRKRTRSVFNLVVDDGGGRLHCRWWNLPYLEGQYVVGMELTVTGRVIALKPRTIDHPETEILEEGDEASIHMGRVVPVHPLTEGVGARWLRGRVWEALERLGAVAEPWPGLACGGLPARAEALRWLHFPPDLEGAERARRRLAWDEFVALQRDIQERRRRLLARAPRWACAGDNRWIRPFLGRLGFRLTSGQAGVLREVRTDLASGLPMRRLVQGDVGSGKTVVAAVTALMVLESGYEVALMAPTEILARQHGRRFREWLEPMGIRVDVRTGAAHVEGTGAEGRLTVGTHALLEQGFAPDRLGLVIIDEQHKFGVAQREALLRKGRCPHLLVMTATPIPRTLALTLYGDLDLSVMEGLPPGRGRVRTFVRGRDRLPKVWEFVRAQLDAGRQAYVVFSRIEGEGDIGEGPPVKAVKREFAGIARALAPHSVGLVHGRLPAEEKDAVMAAFHAGRTAVLVATSVIEVGVDVANATVMVVEDAERFGLAQLHQLRGRIGRGASESFCVLVTAKETPEALGRLGVLEREVDGFAIAEADLRLRGAGDLLGQSQSGLPPFRFADLTGDREVLELARQAVRARWEGRTP